VNPDIKVHSVVSADLDYDHDTAMTIPLGEVSDEQLLAEVARRHIDLHDKITDSLVKETYEIGKVLGHGASGKVYQVTHKVTGQVFACKVVKKNSSMNDAQSMSTEIEIMKRIRHRNIVSMYELYETPKCLWIILELVDGGDLHHYLAQTVHYNEVMASKQFKQILMGCHYLHSLGVVHRDLKLDNILLHVSYTVLYHLLCSSE
jgi:serine/threonine protein kinase